MKKIGFIIYLFIGSLSAWAQKNLEVKDITPELSVYPCNDRHEALVVIRCSESFKLEFKSNVDKELTISQTQEGSEQIYHIVFKTREEGTSFKGRMLSIIAPEFNKYYLPLELTDKQKMEYLVSDPYSTLRSIYYTSIEKGNELFKAGMYYQAKDQYQLAQRCPEYTENANSIQEHLAECDSMVKWTVLVDSANEASNYFVAKTYLEKMINKNTECESLKERYFNIQQNYLQQCNTDMTLGEQYMTDGKYDEAKMRFEHAIKMGSVRSADAGLFLNEIEKLTYKKTNRTRCFYYQFVENRPIGFTYATCQPKKSGGYFSTNFNLKCLDLISFKIAPVAQDKIDYEAGVSFGWTIPVYSPYAWVYFTPFGYVGGGCAMEKTSTDKSSETSTKTVKSWHHAYAPEIGVIGKYWRVTLNYKFQYRYVITKEDAIENMFGKFRHSFGIGFCW